MTDNEWFLLVACISIGMAFGWMLIAKRIEIDRNRWMSVAELRLQELDLAVSTLEDVSNSLIEFHKVSKALVKKIEDVGDSAGWVAANETDRVYAWYEFDDLREAIARVEK